MRGDSTRKFVVVAEVVGDAEVVNVSSYDGCGLALDGGIGLEMSENDGIEQHLRNQQKRCRAKRCKVLTTVAAAFDLEKELISCVESDVIEFYGSDQK